MDRKVKPCRKGAGRPDEGRVKLTVYVLPETEKRVTIATDKSDPDMNTKGKVIDAAMLGLIIPIEIPR